MTTETYKLIAAEQAGGGIVCVIDKTIGSDGFNRTIAEIAHNIDVLDVLVSIPADCVEAERVAENIRGAVSMLVTIEPSGEERVWRDSINNINP